MVASALLLLAFAFSEGRDIASKVNEGAEREALLCRPEGEGPFPAVIYSHGQMPNPRMLQRARDRGWRATCERLASDGFLTFIPVREFSSDRRPRDLPANRNELSRVVDYVKSLPDVDASRVALMGHSRGGLLALMVGLERKDLRGLVITAPANIPPYFSKAVARVSSIDAPTLLLVEVSDEMGSLEAVNVLEKAFRKHGRDVRAIRYDRGGGHFLFVGSGDLYWWNDVRAFLRETLGRAGP